MPRKYLGDEFTLITLTEGKYKLFDPEGRLLFEGQAGESYTLALPDNQLVTIFVAELVASPGVHFELVKRPRLKAMRSLGEQLKISEQGKQSRVLKLALEGSNPRQLTQILNEIANTYLRQNVERKSAEAGVTLQFLEKQLPVLKEQLDSAEAGLNNYRLQEGSVDLPKETQVILEQVVRIEAQLSKLKQDREELLRRFTDQHPRVISIDKQSNILQQELEG